MLFAAEAHVRQAANYQTLAVGLQSPTVCSADVRDQQVVAGSGSSLAGRLGELLVGGYLSFVGGKWKINRPATDNRLVDWRRGQVQGFGMAD